MSAPVGTVADVIPPTLSLSKRRVFKNSVAQMLSHILAGGSKALAAVMVARALGPKGMGVFSLSWTLAGTVSFLAVFGLDYLMIREMARHRDRKTLENSFTLACLLAGGIAVMLVAVPLVMGAHTTVVRALIGAAAYVALSAPVLVLRASFHAAEKMEYESVATTLEGVFAIAGVALALILGWGVAGAMGGLALGRLAALVASLRLYRKLWGSLHPRWDPTGWKPMLKASIPMAASYAFTALYMRFDVVLLAAVRPAFEVGLYGAVSVIILTVPILASSFGGSLYPVLSRAGSADHPEVMRVFDSSVRLLLMASIPMTAGLFLLAGPILKLTYGHDFASATHALMVLSLVLPMRYVNNLAGHVLTAVDRQSKRTTAVIVAAVVNLGLNLVFIPLWGFMGAAYSTLLTEVVLTAFLVPALKPLRFRSTGMVEGSAIAVVMGLVVVIVPGGIIGQLGAGAAVFMLAAAALVSRGRGGPAPKGAPVPKPTLEGGLA